MTIEEAREMSNTIRGKIGDDMFALIADDMTDFIIGYEGMSAREAEMQAIIDEQKDYSEKLRDRIIKMYDRIGDEKGESVTGASEDYVEPETVDKSIFNMISEDGGIIIG